MRCCVCDHDRVVRLADKAEALTGEIAEEITDPARRVWALVGLVKAVVTVGDFDRTARLIDEAERLARRALINPRALLGVLWLCWDDLRVQGMERVDRELLDARALVGHLVAEGSLFAFLAEHRQELFPVGVFEDLFPSGKGAAVDPGVSDGLDPGVADLA